MTGDSSAAARPRVYWLSPLRLAILDGISLALVALPAVILISNPAGIRGALLIFLLLSPTLFILLFTAWYPRLTVLPEGVRVRGAIGYTSLLIPWTNIERVSLRANKEGLILREPLQNRRVARWKNWTGVSFLGAKFYDEEQQRYIDEQRYVPIAIFAYWLRHGALGTDIARYSPSLADDMQARQPGYRKEQSAANRAIIWVFVVSLLICACTVGYAIWSRNQPPERRATLAKGENALDRFAGRAFALSLGIYALMNLRAAFSFWKRKQRGYAAFWLFYAVIQILLVAGIFGS